MLFADAMPAFDAVAAAAAIGARGIMLDTANKSSGSLRTHLVARDLSAFVAHAKAHGLMVGLAGSLAAEDVAPLLALRPDLLGFRGALVPGLAQRGSRSGRLRRDPRPDSARGPARAGRGIAGSRGSSVVLGSALEVLMEFSVPWQQSE